MRTGRTLRFFSAVLMPLCLFGCGLIPSTGTPTAQQTLNAIIADEQLAYGVAALTLSGKALADAQAANAAFQGALPVVQSQVATGTMTPAQVTTALIDLVTAVKTVAGKTAQPATVPSK